MVKLIAYLHYTLLALLFLLTQSNWYSLSAQNITNWDDWKGDKKFFTFENGLLSYKKDDIGGEANIYYDYTFNPKEEKKWSMETLFSDSPTSSNKFKFYLFSCRTATHEYEYGITHSGGSKIGIYVQNYGLKEGKRGEYISTQYLTTINLARSPKPWNELKINITYDPTKGLQLNTYGVDTDKKRSEWVKIEKGTIIPRMGLWTKFSAKKKLKYMWRLPILPAIQLSYVASEVEENEVVHVYVNMPVDVANAKVELVGDDSYSPTITPGNKPDSFTIKLGKKFEANKTYLFKISNIIDTKGDAQTLTVKVETREAHPMPLPAPRHNLWITEIMASPPTTGPLQQTKYIELYNNTPDPLSLGSLFLHYRTSKYKLPDITLPPNGIAVLHPQEVVPDTKRGLLIPMKRFPALKGNFLLKLTNEKGKVYDEVDFSTQLYGKGEENGGASVERIEYKPALWRRSDNKDGGTPGVLTSMQLPQSIGHREIIINEIMLSAGSTGERYLEFYNNSDNPIDLSSIYLSYTNNSEGTSRPHIWLPVKEKTIIEPKSFIVVSPYPDALERLFGTADPSKFRERIDFPSINSTYSEMELRSLKDDKLIDKVIYRKQWLGEQSNDRTGFSLERTCYNCDGTLQSSWQRALGKKGGGTPGKVNSVAHLDNWPKDSRLNYEQFQKLCESHLDLLTLHLYAIDGTPLYSGMGKEALVFLEQIKNGESSLPTTIVVVQASFYQAGSTPAEVYYYAKWLHLVD